MESENELVVVSTFRSTADAQIAQGLLNQVGIQSLVRSDNAGGMYPALDSVELLVAAADVENATAALNGEPPLDSPG